MRNRVLIQIHDMGHGEGRDRHRIAVMQVGRRCDEHRIHQPRAFVAQPGFQPRQPGGRHGCGDEAPDGLVSRLQDFTKVMLFGGNAVHAFGDAGDRSQIRAEALHVAQGRSHILMAREIPCTRRGAGYALRANAGERVERYACFRQPRVMWVEADAVIPVHRRCSSR